MMEKNVPTLPPDVFASVVNALADTLIRDYQQRWNRRVIEPPSVLPPLPTPVGESHWLRVADAARRARCSRTTIYAEVQAGRHQQQEQ